MHRKQKSPELPNQSGRASRGPFAYLAGIAAVVSAGILSYQFFVSKPQISLEVSEATPLLAPVQNKTLEGDHELAVALDGRPVHSPHLIKVEYRNTGTEPISHGDVEEATRVHFEGGRPVLARLEERSPPDVDASCVLERGSLALAHGLLNPSDSFSCVVFTEGAPDLSVTGRIRGVKRIPFEIAANHPPRPFERKSAVTLALLILHSIATALLGWFAIDEIGMVRFSTATSRARREAVDERALQRGMQRALCEFPELVPHVTTDWLEPEGEEQIFRVLERLGEGEQGGGVVRERARKVYSTLMSGISQHVMEVVFPREATGQTWYAIYLASLAVILGKRRLSKDEIKGVLEDAASEASGASRVKLLFRSALGTFVFSIALLLSFASLALVTVMLWISFVG